MKTKLVRPIKYNPKVTSPYGPRPGIGNGFHTGIDYINKDDPGGVNWNGDRSVVAICDGIVIFDYDSYNEAYRFGGNNGKDTGGNMVIIKHNIDGIDYFVRYLHLKENTVSVGTKVLTGQTIGEYSDYGYSFGEHLHIDMFTIDWTLINPTQILLNGFGE